MVKETKAQKETIDRVMHEFKHGELEIRGGRKVKNPKQAIAIALSEAGVSNEKSPEQNKRNYRRTKQKERTGQTAEQQKEGKDAMQHNRAELYAEAKKRNIPGRSKMNKQELEQALHKHG